MEDTMERLMEILKKVLPNVDFTTDADLVDDGIIDSLDVVAIISELTAEYDIEIDSDDIEPENFNSPQAILELVERLMEE